MLLFFVELDDFGFQRAPHVGLQIAYPAQLDDEGEEAAQTVSRISAFTTSSRAFEMRRPP